MAAVLETSKAEFGSSGGGAEDDEEFKKVVQMSIADSGEYHPPTHLSPISWPQTARCCGCLLSARPTADSCRCDGGLWVSPDEQRQLEEALKLSRSQADVAMMGEAASQPGGKGWRYHARC